MRFYIFTNIFTFLMSFAHNFSFVFTCVHKQVSLQSYSHRQETKGVYFYLAHPRCVKFLTPFNHNRLFYIWFVQIKLNRIEKKDVVCWLKFYFDGLVCFLSYLSKLFYQLNVLSSP